MTRSRFSRTTFIVTLSLAVLVLLCGAAAAQSIEGIINGRSGATMTVQTQGAGNVVVLLNDFTTVEDVSGVFHARRKQMGVTALVPGLQVQVQGNYNAQNQLVANTVKFNSKNLQTATDIQAGVTPVEQQEQDPRSALNGWRIFLKWRRSMPVLLHGGIEAIHRSGDILSFDRVLDGTRLRCVFNLAPTPAIFVRDGAEIALEGWDTALIPCDGRTRSFAA